LILKAKRASILDRQSQVPYANLFKKRRSRIVDLATHRSDILTTLTRGVRDKHNDEWGDHASVFIC